MKGFTTKQGKMYEITFVKCDLFVCVCYIWLLSSAAWSEICPFDSILLCKYLKELIFLTSLCKDYEYIKKGMVTNKTGPTWTWTPSGCRDAQQSLWLRVLVKKNPIGEKLHRCREGSLIQGRIILKKGRKLHWSCYPAQTHWVELWPGAAPAPSQQRSSWWVCKACECANPMGTQHCIQVFFPSLQLWMTWLWIYVDQGIRAASWPLGVISSSSVSSWAAACLGGEGQRMAIKSGLDCEEAWDLSQGHGGLWKTAAMSRISFGSIAPEVRGWWWYLSSF